MKTKRNYSRMIISSLVITTMLFSVSCNNSSKAQSETQSNIAPSVDIHAAAFIGDVKSMKQHIQAGSDLNIKDQFGSTPLSIAITFNRVEVAKELIKGGADLTVKGADGSTALHSAAFFCRKEIVVALLEKGADKNALNNYGSTPLQSVSGPFQEIKPFYEQLNKNLGSLGLKLDFDRIEKTRPVIAEMLK